MAQKTVLILRPPAPFRLDLTVWVLRRLPTNVMDRWDDSTYTRAAVFEDTVFQVHVRQKGPADRPELEVSLSGARSSASRVSFVTRFLERILGLGVDLGPFYERALHDPELGPVAGRFLGFRPPRFPSAFEAAVNGISCQQLSLHVGIQLLNRLCERYGPESGGCYAFPRPQDLASVKIDELKRLGYSSRKAEYILHIARGGADGKMDLDRLASQDDERVMETLLKIPGVGSWTAEYIMLRGLGRLNSLPAGDVGLQNNLKRRLALNHRPDAPEVRKRLSKWAPYMGLMYFYFLLDYLCERGML